MRSNIPGNPSPHEQDPAGSDIALPADVQHDLDRVEDLVHADFPPPLWSQTASELYEYAYRRLLPTIRRTDKLVEATAKSATPLVMFDEERSTLYRSPRDRESLAIHTIDIAMATFPLRLKQGGYAPAQHPGKDGKPSRLTSYFYGRCLLVFPRVFYAWRTERSDSFVKHATRLPDNLLAYALGQSGPEPVPEGVAELCETLTEMINSLKPRPRAVMRLTVAGWSQGEIAEELDIKVGDVENDRFGFRKKVRTQRRRGQLHVPAEIRAEWARATGRSSR